MKQKIDLKTFLLLWIFGTLGACLGQWLLSLRK